MINDKKHIMEGTH